MRSGISFLQALRVLAIGASRGRARTAGGIPCSAATTPCTDAARICGVRYKRESGTWLGAVALGYGVGALCAVALGLIEFVWHPFANAGIHPLWTITIISLVVTAFGYRHAKGLWFALLWLYESTDGPEAQDDVAQATSGGR